MKNIKAATAVIIAVFMVVGSVAVWAHDTQEITAINAEVNEVPFLDVEPNDWFYNAVAWAWHNGIMNGVSNTKFAPNAGLTRAMLVTVLWRYAGSPNAGESLFTDVASNAWYSTAIAWAAENGIVMGFNETTFGVNYFVTREQMYTILYRYMNFAGLAIDLDEEMHIQQFADAGEISYWAKDAMHFMHNAGIMFTRSTVDLYARPQDNAFRAEVAAAMFFFNRRAESRYSEINFNVRVERTNVFAWNVEQEFPEHPAVIASMYELANYLEFFSQHVLLWNIEGQPTYMNDAVFGMYTEEFFEHNFLVILYFEEPSGSNRHRVDGVLENGDILVTRLLADVGTADMAGWHIIIEIDSNITFEQVNLIVRSEMS